MRAISPGRPQSTRQALCTAHWDGLRLVAYISGNTVIILDGPRNILQTLSVDNSRSLLAVTIEETSGRIAVCDEHRVHIYNAVGRDEDDLRWAHGEELEVGKKDTISCLSWGSSEELLIGGSQLWLYHLPHSGEVRIIWQQKIANPVAIAAFSNDAELIATCGHHDRIIKIWRRLSHELDNTRFDISYLPHPSAVTGIHWRKPWHQEQALDNLLYTFCSDDHVRLWTYSDSHSLSVMQLIITIDTNTSIQPRRLSVSTISRRRFVFILDSRDFSQAAEKSLQQVQAKTVNHALEHLIEVANRSPEICVVFDGLGHMSAWGLENAGCRSRKPAVLFNVTLVDDLRIQLNFESGGLADFVQFCSFAGGRTPASLSLLVHSYTGQIDWYESPIAQFFDTSTHDERLQLTSSWSGHDLAIDHIARAVGSNEILSWTDEGQAILWKQTTSGALQRMCQVHAMENVLAVVLLSGQGHMISLHSDVLILWSLCTREASQISRAPLQSKAQPRLLRLIVPPSRSNTDCRFVVEYEDSSIVLWSVRIPDNSPASPPANGIHKSFVKIDNVESNHVSSSTRSVILDESALMSRQSHTDHLSLMNINVDGVVRAFQLQTASSNNSMTLLSSMETGISRPMLSRATATGLLALTDAGGKTLSIFNVAQGSREWIHEFSGPDHIHKMAWTSTKTGAAILFVSFSYHAYVIGQRRYSATGDGHCWTIFQDISLRDFTTNYIGDVSWLPSSDLAIAAGNQIFVVESRCNRTESEHNAVGYQADETVIETVSRLNSVLPVYHPAYLHFITEQGEFGKVADILTRLHEKLKYFAEGDELDSFLDQDPSYWSPTKDSNTHAGDMVTIGEIAASLREYITSTDLPQLSAEERSGLYEFVSIFIRVEKQMKSLDENALHYLFALYATPDDQTMPWRAFVFASRSTSQEALVDLVLHHHNNKLTWDVARRTGLFVWLEDKIALQTQFENVARAEYNKHEDRNPVDCSLYYLALNKKNVLQGLWRMTVGVKEKENTMKLLANNFNDQRWKSTALKNAYALLSKRRFEYAAAFFLLGSSLKDAINVCVNQLKDLQLAIAIARVWKHDQAQSQAELQDLLATTVVCNSIKHEEGRWIAVWAFTLLEQPADALQAITRPLHQSTDSPPVNGSSPSSSYRSDDPHLVQVYRQVRDDLVRTGKWSKGILNDDEEHAYLRRVRAWLSRAGLDLCAMHLVSSWVFKDWQLPATTTRTISQPSKSIEAIARKEDAQPPPIEKKVQPRKPAPTQFVEPSTDSLLDSFGF